MTDRSVPEFLAFGDLGVDSVARIDHLPRPDEKLWVEPLGDRPGGMMGNAAATVAALGCSAGVAGLLGTDGRGTFVLEALRDRGVETRFVRRIEATTFWTLSLTTPSGDRTLIQFPTPAFGAAWDGFDVKLLGDVRWVHTTAEQGETVAEILGAAKQAGATTSLDIEHPFVLREDLMELVRDVDVAFLNAAAAEALGGPEEAARSVQRGGVTTSLVTLGKGGALLLEQSGEACLLPAIDVEAVDTNGAGDAFAAGYAVGAMRGLRERDAAALAVFVAGLSTTVTGGFGPDHDRLELRARAKQLGYEWWDVL